MREGESFGEEPGEGLGEGLGEAPGDGLGEALGEGVGEGEGLGEALGGGEAQHSSGVGVPGAVQEARYCEPEPVWTPMVSPQTKPPHCCDWKMRYLIPVVVMVVKKVFDWASRAKLTWMTAPPSTSVHCTPVEGTLDRVRRALTELIRQEPWVSQLRAPEK